MEVTATIDPACREHRCESGAVPQLSPRSGPPTTPRPPGLEGGGEQRSGSQDTARPSTTTRMEELMATARPAAVIAELSATVDYLRITVGGVQRTGGCDAHRWSPIPKLLGALIARRRPIGAPIRTTWRCRCSCRATRSASPRWRSGRGCSATSSSTSLRRTPRSPWDAAGPTPSASTPRLRRSRRRSADLHADTGRRTPRPAASPPPIGPAGSAPRCCGATSPRPARRRSAPSPARCRPAGSRSATGPRSSSPRPVRRSGDAGRLVRVGEQLAWERRELLPVVPDRRRPGSCEDCSLRTDEDRQERYAAMRRRGGRAMILFGSNADTELLALRSVVETSPATLGERALVPPRPDRRRSRRSTASTLVVVRLLGGAAPWEDGLRRPARRVRRGGVPLVARRRRARARRRAAAGVDRAGRRRRARRTATSPPAAPRTWPTCCASCPTRVLLTGLGFDAAARRSRPSRSGTAPASGAPGRSASTRPAAGRRRLLPRPPRGREHTSSIRDLRGGAGAAPAPTRWRSRRTRCAPTPTARVAALELCREHGVDVDHHLDAGGRVDDRRRRRLVRARARRRSASRSSRRPSSSRVARAWLGRRRRARPARRRHRRRHPRVRRAHHRADVRVQGGRRRRRRRRAARSSPTRADPERTARLAAPRRAHGPARDASRNDAKRVAIVLSAYPTKRARLGNAVGLDTPASAIALLARAARRRLPRRPHPGRRRRADGRAGRPGSPTTSRRSRDRRWRARRRVAWTSSAYAAWFDALPDDARDGVEAVWGPAPGEVYVARRRARTSPASTSAACSSRSSRPAASAPTRSARTTPRTCRRRTTTSRSTGGSTPPVDEGGWGADAIVHLGKHGTLEWLPGKALALSAGCYPDAAIGRRAASSTRSSSTTPARARRPSGGPTPSSSTTCHRR